MRIVYHVLTLSLLVPTVHAADKASAPPWKENPPIVRVKRELYKKSPKPKAAALVAVEYIGPKLERIEWNAVEVLDDVWDENQSRWSNDNGRTWTPFVAQAKSTNVNYQGVTVWEGGICKLYDPTAEAVVDLWLRQIAVKGVYNCFSYSRTSRDQGRTWSAPKQLRYEEGEAFDPQQPLKPGFLKNNRGYPGNSILRLANGKLFACLVHANAKGDPDNEKRAWKMGAVPFLGQWNAMTKEYDWTAGKRIEVSPDLTSRGLMEPDSAELVDGRVLTIYRGSSTPKTPGRKFFHVSTDGGKSFDDVKELRYDDGSAIYSPSSIHRFLRHSVTKKLYWIGNICAAPPQGNLPRYPLVIAEVDEKIPALKRKTVTAIDDRRPEQTAALQLSNFSLLENRETHELELHLSTYGQEAGSTYTADNYKYTLTFVP